LLGKNLLDRIELLVVGEVRNSQRATALLERAAAYPHVVFTGYQADSRSLYASVDLQAVGSTEATGLRTRIVESFAYGVPVISTTVGAAGVEGLRSGENVILADDPEPFARAIRDLADRPRRLQEISEAGRRTYDDIYSRSAVAANLRQYLTTYFGGQAPAGRDIDEPQHGRRTNVAGASS
jgi:glycosyltransferase involved in cell wall biosynthesis